MSYFSTFYQIEVRDEIVKEFTDLEGDVDDMMAGLHEVRARLGEEDPWLRELHASLRQRELEAS